MIECCGNCEWYTYEGENRKGSCGYYGDSYYPSDSCRHFREGEEHVTESKGGCFLTTACCAYKGLKDDCEELETLRAFRDGYLARQEYGPELTRMYYEDAPAIVDWIESRPDRDALLESIYARIVKCVDLINKKEYDAAIIRYLMMVYELKRQAQE